MSNVHATKPFGGDTTPEQLRSTAILIRVLGRSDKPLGVDAADSIAVMLEGLAEGLDEEPLIAALVEEQTAYWPIRVGRVSRAQKDPNLPRLLLWKATRHRGPTLAEGEFEAFGDSLVAVLRELKAAIDCWDFDEQRPK